MDRQSLRGGTEWTCIQSLRSGTEGTNNRSGVEQKRKTIVEGRTEKTDNR